MTRRRRVLYVNPSSELGGAEHALLLLLRGLDRDRYEPTVACPEVGRFSEALEQDGVPFVLAPLGKVASLSRSGSPGAGRVLTGALAAGGALSRLLSVLRPLRPDLIHTNGMKAHLLGGLAGRVLRRPVIWHMRDLPPEGRGGHAFLAAARRLPARILTVSTAVAERHGNLDRVRVVHDALDPQRVRVADDPAEVRRSLGIPESAMAMAMVAHFTRWKGHDVFLEALARVRAAGVDARGVIVGGSIYSSAVHGCWEGEVRDHAVRLGLGDAVQFTGYRSDTADLIHACDLLVHPPTRPEPFGLAVIEAMALGRPVVGADAGGLRETVTHGQTGLLVSPGNAEAFAAAILELARDPQRRAAMGEAGRERVHRHFSPARHHETIHTIYEEILGS